MTPEDMKLARIVREILLERKRLSHLPPTQRSIYHFHNNICRIFDLGDWSFFNGYNMWLLKDDCSHHTVFHHCCQIFVRYSLLGLSLSLTTTEKLVPLDLKGEDILFTRHFIMK